MDSCGPRGCEGLCKLGNGEGEIRLCREIGEGCKDVVIIQERVPPATASGLTAISADVSICVTIKKLRASYLIITVRESLA